MIHSDSCVQVLEFGTQLRSVRYKMVSTLRVWYGAILLWSRDDLDNKAAMRADQLLLASRCTSGL